MNEYGDFGFFDKISGYQDSDHLTEKLRFIQSLFSDLTSALALC